MNLPYPQAFGLLVFFVLFLSSDAGASQLRYEVLFSRDSGTEDLYAELVVDGRGVKDAGASGFLTLRDTTIQSVKISIDGRVFDISPTDFLFYEGLRIDPNGRDLLAFENDSTRKNFVVVMVDGNKGPRLKLGGMLTGHQWVLEYPTNHHGRGATGSYRIRQISPR